MSDRLMQLADEHIDKQQKETDLELEDQDKKRCKLKKLRDKVYNTFDFEMLLNDLIEHYKTAEEYSKYHYSFWAGGTPSSGPTYEDDSIECARDFDMLVEYLRLKEEIGEVDRANRDVIKPEDLPF